MVKDLIIFVGLGLVAGFGWYKYWVEPQDEWRMAVISCMDGDRSRVAYDRCVEIIGEPR